MKKYFAVSLILMVIGIAGHAAYADHQAFLQRVVVVSPGYWEPTRGELREAMRYHGIGFAEEDQNHEWYFMRDGKKCLLFGYLKNEERG